MLKQKSTVKRIVFCTTMAICGIGTIYYFAMQQKGLKKEGYGEPLVYCTNSYERMLVFAQGFATQMVVSFSLTIYASSTRIYIYLYFSFIFVIAILIELLKEYFGRKLWGMFILIFIAGAGVNYITLLHLSQAITRLYS